MKKRLIVDRGHTNVKNHPRMRKPREKGKRKIFAKRRKIKGEKGVEPIAPRNIGARAKKSAGTLLP